MATEDTDDTILEFTWVTEATDLVAATLATFTWHPFLLMIAFTWPFHTFWALRDLLGGEGFSLSWFMVLGIAAIAYFPRVLARRHCARLTDRERTVTYLLSEQGVEIRGPRAETSIAFSEMLGWGQTRAIFGLVLPGSVMHAIPKRALSAQDIERVEALLRRARFASGRTKRDRQQVALFVAIAVWVGLLGAVGVLYPLVATSTP